ncbi:hypothetical protein MMC07_005498 [Pseudocyphellaria aurata]|nr:hypothetical protein [Pseudocyphellaria aurata]
MNKTFYRTSSSEDEQDSKKRSEVVDPPDRNSLQRLTEFNFFGAGSKESVTRDVGAEKADKVVDTKADEPDDRFETIHGFPLPPGHHAPKPGRSTYATGSQEQGESFSQRPEEHTFSGHQGQQGGLRRNKTLPKLPHGQDDHDRPSTYATKSSGQRDNKGSSSQPSRQPGKRGGSSGGGR